ncbi:hypothetical protein Sipo8835_09995 [Streptomyces ipomoeae]|uniref:Terpene synthase n=1 Tax=Streptomyces ipomoeae TaxID=103232 RepID=A0AAE8W4I2_9ACTN|nr:terpene synthase family protein [Streptomyces ipomoeae]MDX2827384.1 terpene synthase family protein [Streptomyces ipomoeae]MDX2880543.1 terpene synthase family protein [Streptomyces ipomoeae]TQE36546.1 hypothetical protein Sipo8835_09995 [Streptomyces ipomoeae]
MELGRQNFFVPVELIHHPEEDRIAEAHADWLIQTGLLPKDRAEHFVESHRMGEFGSLLWPFTRFPDVVWASNGNGWGFLLEEVFEGPHQLEGQARQDFVTSLVDVIWGRKAGSSVWETAVQQCVAASNEGMSARWADLHRENWCSYVRGYLAEARHRDAGGDLGFEDTRALRRQSLGAAPAMDFVECLARREIPWHIRQLPELTLYFTYTLELSLFANDLMSLRREREMGDVNNTVMAYRKEHGCDWDTAMRYVVDLFNARGHDVLDLEAEILRMPEVRKLSAAQGADVRAYLIALRQLPYGYLEWHFITGRYDDSGLFYVTERMV